VTRTRRSFFSEGNIAEQIPLPLAGQQFALAFFKVARSCIYCFGNFYRIPVILVKHGKSLPAIRRQTATGNSPRRQRACDDDADDIACHTTFRGC